MKGVAERTLELVNEFQKVQYTKSYRSFQHFLIVKIETLEDEIKKIGINTDAYSDENEALRNAGRGLMSVLPDSVGHENPDCWEWCWNELTGEAQDDVKSARNDWNDALLTREEQTDA